MRRWRGLIGPAADIGLPTAAYYLARMAGSPEVAALLIAAAVAFGRIAWVAVRTRSITWVAAISVAGYGIGAVLALVSGNPTLVLLKESASTTIISLCFLVSARTTTPITLTLSQSFAGDRADELRVRVADDLDLLRRFRSGSILWGAGLLFDAVARIPIVLWMPMDVAVVVGQVLLLVVVAVLGVWTWFNRVPLRDALPVGESG